VSKTIGDQKVPDDSAIIDRFAIPLAGDRVGVDREGIIHRLDPRPAEVFRRWTRRCRGHHPAIRIPELRPLIGPKLDVIAILVDMAMMEGTQERGIIQAGLAAVGPVLGVVAFQEDPVGAPGERTG